LTEIMDLVVASLRADAEFSSLSDLPDAALARSLVQQVHLANWLSQSAADFFKRNRLELVVVHAGYGASREAQWFDLAFSHVLKVLGGPANLSLKIASAGNFKLPLTPTNAQIAGTLEEFAKADPARPLDVVLLLNPEFSGFAQYDAESGVIADLLTGGARIVAKSPDVVSFEREQWVLSLYGYRSSVIQDIEGEREASTDENYVLWAITSRGDMSQHVDYQLARLDQYDTYLAEIAAYDGMIERPFLGNQTYVVEPPEDEQGRREDRSVVGLPIRLHVDIVSGTLFQVDPETNVLCYLECRGYCVPDKILQAYQSDALAFERALWAAEVSLTVEDALDTLRYLEATAGKEPDTTDEDMLGRVKALVNAQSPRRDSFQFPTPGCLPLFRALRRGDVDLALQIVNDSPYLVNATDGLGNSPIFLLVDRPLHYLEHFKRLGADFRHVNNQGQSILHRIAQAGTAEAASFVLSIGSDPDVKDSLLVTPALTAAINRNFAVLDVLIFCGARTDVKTSLGYSLSDVWSILALKPDLQHLISQRSMPN